MAKIYDKYQREVIDISEGHHLVLAPPGCGKTDILAERIYQAHSNGVEYGDMLCLTFTNRASRGMRDRIEHRTNNPVPMELFVGNLHRFCSRFLFSNYVVNYDAPIIDEFDTMSALIKYIPIIPDEDDCVDCDEMERMDKWDWKQREFVLSRSKMQHLCSQILLEHPREVWMSQEMIADLEFFCGKILGNTEELHHLLSLLVDYFENNENVSLEGFVNYCKRKGVDVNDDLCAGDDEVLLVFDLLFSAYMYGLHKKEDGSLDFDDLLIVTYDELLKRGDKYKKYKWIQIDEVQDLNPLQFAIVDLLEDEKSTVVYLGDEQQAIFSFMGAKLDSLSSLEKKCNGNIHRLYKNYRSPKYLLDVYNTYASKILDVEDELLPTTDYDIPHKPQDLYCASLANNNNATETIAYIAQRYNELDGGSVAVLVRTNPEADSISKVFSDRNIPHFKISGKDVFLSPTIRAILSHLNVIQNEMSFIHWARLLYHLGIIDGYSKARDFMRDLKNTALVPSDLMGKRTYLSEFVDSYKEEEIVLFDTETTGLDIFNDDIVQIAAKKIRNGKEVPNSEKVIYLESDKSLPLVVGGKPNPMIDALSQARKDGVLCSRKQGLADFLEYCRGAVLVAHNINFDYHILKFNIERDLPSERLYDICPKHYDTLKLIRLLEPRLKVYKLERLLEVLHLEGVNSHNAIDDVNATMGLLDECYRRALKKIGTQMEFLNKPAVAEIAKLLRNGYEPLYRQGLNRLYNQEDGQKKASLLVQEMLHAHDFFTNNSSMPQVDKWTYITDYYDCDIVDKEKYPSLIEQLNAFITEINTSKESDMCGSKSMKANFFISTVYKAKGLEFDNVIVPSVVKDVYPLFSRYDSEGEIADVVGVKEDARLLYVALSRAKKRLCVVWYKSKEVYSKRWDKTYTFPSTISPFMQPIRKYFAEKNKNE